MKGGASLSRFTPSLLPHETLEAIFVKREKLASRLTELVRESATTKNKHYSLLIGPRGIGKTHLVSLVYHRVKRDPQVADRLLVAWLREEEWGIASFLDLLLAILRSLYQEYKNQQLATECDKLCELSIEHAELAAEELLRRTAGEKTLLLMSENLDEIFRSIGERGQEKLRAYIQNHPFFTILATSQSLFDGVSLRASPFYGFFGIHHLQELSYEDAVSMLTKIAQYEGNGEFVSLIRTAQGRARIRAVHHIAAGNPRVYVIFSQFLTSSSFDQLVEPLIRTLDDLTPYYEARMSSLPPQQRKILEFLCDRRYAVTVSEIARFNYLTPQTTSSQLGKLRETGYVRSEQSGRESYYELREPLMRICLEIKKLRGEPVRLFVEFLRLWYSQAELPGRLTALDPDALSGPEALMEVDCWDERVEALSSALARSAQEREEDLLCEVAIVRNLLVHTRDESTWRRLVGSWIELFDRYDVLAALGQGVVSSIPALKMSWISDAAATRWNLVWQELGRGHRDLEVPLRFLDTAVRFRVENDPRVLLGLPLEERRLLEPLVGIRREGRSGDRTTVR